MNPSPGQILALDVGLRRTGIARASVIARLPEPLMSVATEKIDECLEKLIAEYSVDTVVVGLPRSLNGNETGQTKWTREWVRTVAPKHQVSWYYQDEALTSELAKARAAQHDIDAHAAAEILDDFLKLESEDRMPC